MLQFTDKINSLKNENKSDTASSSKDVSAVPSSRNSVKTNNSDEEEVDENAEGPSSTAPTARNKSSRKVRVIFRARLKNVDRTDVEVKEVTVNNVTVVITEFKLKRKLSEVSENNIIPTESEPPSKKIKESPSKNTSPDKNAAKESPVSSSRSKGSADKKSPTKGAKAKLEETNKKRSSNSNQADLSDHGHHSSSSKKNASTDKA